MLPHVWGSAPSGDPSGPPQAAQGGFAGPSGLSGQVLEELEDRVRKLVEDCDHLQVWAWMCCALYYLVMVVS